MIQGTLYIVSAPSGTGKSSLIQALLENTNLHNTQVSISYTTRAIRPGEKNGQHYFFVSIKEFEQMIAEDTFLEYARVFDHYYGTSREKINKLITMGMDVVLDIDWQGAQKIRKKMSNVKSIFILPPSRSELDKRLRSRGQDSDSVIARRIERSVSEITHHIWYDYLIINDNFHTALLDLKAIIRAERLHLNRQRLRHNILIRNLLKD